MPFVSYSCASLTATGTGQSDAAEIGDDNVEVTSTADNQGVRIPNACGRFLVRNANTGMSLFNVIVYPPTGGSMASPDFGAGKKLFPGSSPVLFVTTDHVNWHWVATT